MQNVGSHPACTSQRVEVITKSSGTNNNSNLQTLFHGFIFAYQYVFPINCNRLYWNSLCRIDRFLANFTCHVSFLESRKANQKKKHLCYCNKTFTSGRQRRTSSSHHVSFYRTPFTPSTPFTPFTCGVVPLSFDGARFSHASKPPST
jgi:hypothetical protein